MSHSSCVELFVRTTRGIEWIAAAEADALLQPCTSSIEHRAIRLGLGALSPAALRLATADDVFMVVSRIPAIGRHRADLALLANGLRGADLAGALDVVRGLRDVPRRPTFAVTASFLGRRNFTRYEIEDRVAEALVAAAGWRYRATGQAVSIRVHLADETATIAIRIAAEPLHRRPYRVRSRPGSLHPPLARALALLAGLRPGASILDPFCGAGTVVIEAALAEPGLRASAYDIDAAAVADAEANARAAGASISLGVADALDLAGRAAAVDRIVANPPWRRAVESRGGLRRRPAAVWAGLGGLSRAEGRMALLVPVGAELAALESTGLAPVLRNPVRVSGAWAEIVVLAGGGPPVDPHGALGGPLAQWLPSR